MRQRNPTQAQCSRLEREILAAVGLRTFRELHRTVIHRGFLASDLDRDSFNRLQGAFHAVQGLRWAREDRPERRGPWIADARRRAERLDIRLN